LRRWRSVLPLRRGRWGVHLIDKGQTDGGTIRPFAQREGC
jgi:hypothetical protein